MIQKLILTTTLIGAAACAHAAENITYICTKDTQTRTIRVEYQNQTAPVPCSVTYQRGNEAKKVIWTAQNQQGFCEEKAVEFVQKQSEWGWGCKN